MARESTHQEEVITTTQKTAYWRSKENVATRKFGSLMKLLVSLVAQTLANWIVVKPNQAAKEFQEAWARVIAMEVEIDSAKSVCRCPCWGLKYKHFSYLEACCLRWFYDWRFFSYNAVYKECWPVRWKAIVLLFSSSCSKQSVWQRKRWSFAVMTGHKVAVRALTKNETPMLVNVYSHRPALCTRLCGIYISDLVLSN